MSGGGQGGKGEESSGSVQGGRREGRVKNAWGCTVREGREG